MNKILLCCLFPLATFAQKITTKVERSGFKETPTYYEIIDWWKQLDAKSANVKMEAMGPSDAGFPLHLITVSAAGEMPVSKLASSKKRVILINNGIHPGEPDGIDASMMLVRDIVEGKKRLPINVILAIIPVYNIGGCLNRSTSYRVDQNGPDEFGFRGNSQNLDLNRDFIKSDSKEAKSFAEIFHACDPDIFLDNHVSNGADYQHIMTLLTAQHNKLGGEMGQYLNEVMEPAIYGKMKERGYDLVPYVNHFGETPDNGWQQFFDAPRYSSGYASLFQTFAFTPETHILKPYEQRVKSTYALMESFIDFAGANSDKIAALRKGAKEKVRQQGQFPLSWTIDKEKFTEIEFKGYASGKKPSAISGQPRLYYDRSQPFTRKVKFYNTYKDAQVTAKPEAYILPQGWWKVAELLKANRVEMKPLRKDTVMEVEVQYITDYKTSPRQYEMHHMNSDVKTRVVKEKVKFRKGDWYIPMNQRANRFLMEILEPTAPDSYFAWNYFDAILGQKEGYSSYVFEDTAEEFLKNHPDVRQKLEEKKSSDTAFARNGGAQLNWVFQNSGYYEKDHMRYPVYRK